MIGVLCYLAIAQTDLPKDIPDLMERIHTAYLHAKGYSDEWKMDWPGQPTMHFKRTIDGKNERFEVVYGDQRIIGGVYGNKSFSAIWPSGIYYSTLLDPKNDAANDPAPKVEAESFNVSLTNRRFVLLCDPPLKLTSIKPDLFDGKPVRRVLADADNPATGGHFHVDLVLMSDAWIPLDFTGTLTRPNAEPVTILLHSLRVSRGLKLDSSVFSVDPKDRAELVTFSDRDWEELAGTPVKSLPRGAEVKIPATVYKNAFFIHGTINSRPATFFVDTGASATIIKPGPLKAADQLGARITVGNLSKSVVAHVADYNIFGWLQASIPEGDRNGVIGILGMDFLQDYAVGFDFDKPSVSFWPGGLETGGGKTWVANGQDGPHKSTLPAFEIPIANRFHGRYGVQLKLGDLDTWLNLDSGSTEGELLPSRSSAGGAETMVVEQHTLANSTIEVARKLVPVPSFGGHVIPWWVFSDTEANHYDDFGDPKPEGVLGPSGFLSSRVLIDFPDRYMSALQPDDDVAFSFILTSLLWKPLSVKGEEIRFGPTSPSDGAELRALEGVVTSIADHKPSEIIAALRAKNPTSLALLRSLCPTAQKPCHLVIQTKAGSHDLYVLPA